LLIIKKAQSKHSPIGRKFAQSGHPGYTQPPFDDCLRIQEEEGSFQFQVDCFALAKKRNSSKATGTKTERLVLHQKVSKFLPPPPPMKCKMLLIAGSKQRGRFFSFLQMSKHILDAAELLAIVINIRNETLNSKK
jgi:hypothetical protein